MIMLSIPDEELTAEDIADLKSRAQSLNSDINDITVDISDADLIHRIHHLVQLPDLCGVSTPYEQKSKSIHDMTRSEIIAMAKTMIKFTLSL